MHRERALASVVQVKVAFFRSKSMIFTANGGHSGSGRHSSPRASFQTVLGSDWSCIAALSSSVRDDLCGKVCTWLLLDQIRVEMAANGGHSGSGRHSSPHASFQTVLGSAGS